MNYAIDYQLVEHSLVLAWEKEEEEPEIFFLKGQPERKTKKGLFVRKKVSQKEINNSFSLREKSEFIEKLSKKDKIFLELGGASDRFALACLKKGAQVLHCPTYLIKKEKEKEKKKENTAQIIYRWIREGQLEKFYPLREQNYHYLEIARLIKSYRIVQRKMRLPTEARFRNLQQDLEFIGEDAIAQEVKNLSQLLENVALPERLKSIEEEIKKELKERLNQLPLYQEVFQPLRGIGEVTAAAIIAGILDIRKFQKLSQLRKMFGCHLVKTKEGKWQWPRKRKGQPREGKPLLIEALNIFLEQLRFKNLDPLWQKEFEMRVEKEKEKIPQILNQELPEDPKKRENLILAQALVRARHWLAQKFVKYIWQEWRRFEGIS